MALGTLGSCVQAGTSPANSQPFSTKDLAYLGACAVKTGSHFFIAFCGMN